MMPTRNVVVTDRQDRLIDDLVEAGRYQNASEVLRVGLRLIEREEARHEASIAALRASVQEGLDAIERGHFKAFDNFDALDAYLVEATEPLLIDPKRD